MPTFELSSRNAILHRYDLLIAPLNFYHTLGINTPQHNDLPYLVAGDTESLEKTLFHDVTGHQRLGLARSAFLPGDNSNVGMCPDPSSRAKDLVLRLKSQ